MPQILTDITWLSVTVRILLAMLIGALLGIGRGRKRRPAGFRTYMLVCVGSAIVMMTNQYVFQTYGVDDLVRMGAQVVSGIGFLGAGTIILTGKNQVRGITTAAGLWTAACCGLAVGIGFYMGAVAGAATILIIMTLMQRVDSKIHAMATTLEVYVEFERETPFSNFIKYAREHGFDVSDIQLSKSAVRSESFVSAIITLECKHPMQHSQMLMQLSGADGVLFMEEVSA